MYNKYTHAVAGEGGENLSSRAFQEHRTHNYENKTNDFIWKTKWEEATWKCLVNCRRELKPQWQWLNTASMLVGRTDDQKVPKTDFINFPTSPTPGSTSCPAYHDTTEASALGEKPRDFCKCFLSDRWSRNWVALQGRWIDASHLQQ